MYQQPGVGGATKSRSHQLQQNINDFDKQSFTETERNLKVRLQQAVAAGSPHQHRQQHQHQQQQQPPRGLQLQPLAPVPGSTFALGMNSGPATTKAQVNLRKKLLHDISRSGQKKKVRMSSEGVNTVGVGSPVSFQQQPSSLGTDPNTSATNTAVEIYHEDRILDAGARLQKKLSKLKSSDSPAHSLAPFMKEITAFVETQLQRLESQFPTDEATHQPRHTPSTLLLPDELSAKRSGCAEPTREEMKRKLRLGIFMNAERMFADSFKSYKLFLDAIADEHQSYVAFLQEDLTLHKEVLLGMRDTVAETKREARELVEKHDQERRAVLDRFENEQKALSKWRLMNEEAAVKQKSQESHMKNQLMELELRCREAEEENKRLKSEVETLTRQNNSLCVSTFSDALENANNQIMDLKALCVKKDETISACHDDYTELSKDLKTLADYYQRLTAEELQDNDVKLSKEGFRLLFPELARKKHLKKMD